MPSGFFALRAPLLPFAALREWGDGLECARRPDDAAAWQRGRALARDRLRAHVASPEVLEAIFLASPALEERVPAWLADPDAEPGVEAGLVKYVARMTARCTPFGTFASTTVGHVGREPRLALPARRAAVRHTRLDMEFLSEVVARLAADPAVRERLRFVPNTGLYAIGPVMRYAEARRVQGARAYFLVNVTAHPALHEALGRAREGATVEQLATALVTGDIPLEDARGFVLQLIEAQILVPDLGPVVTGPDALEDLLARLALAAPEHPAHDALRGAREALAELDRGGLGHAPQAYGARSRALESLAPVDPARLFQVDLFRPAAGLTLDEGLVDEMLRAADLLVGLFLKGRRDPLAEFRRAFEERYGDREVPMAEALDEDLGIGFEAGHGPASDASPLLAGLPFPPALEGNLQPWGERAQFVQWRLAEAIARGDAEMRFAPAELERFVEADAPALPAAFHLMASLLAADDGAPDAPRAVLESAAGPSGARLLGRFGHGDPGLLACMREHLRAEEALRPDLAYFEIVHLPEGRIGNVLARPLLREWELEFLGASGAPRDRRLTITDLTLRMEAGRVVLRCPKLGREVRPRLTSAHYTGFKSLGVYRFLAALQSEGAVEGVSWHWGPLEHQPRLPRVRLGRLVLSRQTWNERADEARRLRALRGHAAFREVQRWRGERGLPRFVGLSNADNVLPVDLDQPLSVEAFLAEIGAEAPFALQELLPGGATDAVETPEGRLNNEIVIPVVRRRVPAAPARPRVAGDEGSRIRLRSSPEVPGDPWVTLKFYTGPAMADRLLVERLHPLLGRLEGAEQRSMFFVRYADPDWHVRLRVRSDGFLASNTTSFLRLATGGSPEPGGSAVHKVQIDAYVPEIVRYGGGEALSECEALFHHDSVAALAFLEAATGERGLDARWRFAFLGMDRLLADFGFDVPARQALVAREAGAFAREFQVDRATRRAMMARYRDERPALEAARAGELDHGTLLAEGARLLAARSEANRPHVAALRRLESARHLAAPIEDIVASLLHMHANRVLRSSHRAQEMVIHHYLENAYGSDVARARGGSAPAGVRGGA